MNNTPGYDFRIKIRLTTDKKGRERAAYWSWRTQRWLPIKIVDAWHWLATDQADRVEG